MKLMEVALGFLFILLTFVAWFRRNKLEESPLLLRILLFSIPLPYLAIELGWVVAEVGRQPWIVNGIMRTSDAASPIVSIQVAITLVAFMIVYGLLGIAAFYIMAKYAKEGPIPVEAKIKAKPAARVKTAKKKGGK